MKISSIAPCGVNCDICLGFQREKNKCVGCNGTGNKVNHCTVCGIKTCPEKHGRENELCIKCKLFPCRRIKDLDKRYTIKYGESVIINLKTIGKIGIKAFIKLEKEKWKCGNCGKDLCVHREVCPHCGKKNRHYPKKK